MNQDEFENQFVGLTGFAPMPWQSRFYMEYFDQGRLPSAADIPTGLGKTAVTALWLIALRAGRVLPRRLVYVVDRRAVVDQATDFIEGLRQRLPERERFPISTLRGKHADNREWLDDPSQPAVIVGTVDMIGSRLLFEGYGVSRRMRPYHAGLLGADSLIVLDEAHLVPPFERLLADIENGGTAYAAYHETDRALVPKLSLLSLSATGRERKGDVFRLTEQDLGNENSLTRQRLGAKKVLTIADGYPKNLAEDLAAAAWSLTEGGTLPVRCLVYCHSREDAEATCNLLQKRVKHAAPVELFVGARRGYERDKAAERLRTIGFLAGAEEQPDTVRFLVATSAGEVGIDLDADHMVCDLVPWERMVQRLGRVNRRGNGAARVLVIDTGPHVPKNVSDAEKARIEARHRRVRELLEALPHKEDGRDASPHALRELKQGADAERRALLELATTPSPLRPALTRPLLDAWSMTSLAEHTGRPEVMPWLRGWVDDEPQTTVVWRAHLPVPVFFAELKTEREKKEWRKDVEAYFEATPPQVSEQLETESRRVAEWLVSRAEQLVELAEAARKSRKSEGPLEEKPLAKDRVIAVALTGAGEFSKAFTLQELAGIRRERLQRDIENRTLVVLDRFAGLAETGTLAIKSGGAPAWVGDRDGAWPPEEQDRAGRTFPWRVVRLDGEEANPGEDWHKRFEFVLDRDGDGEVTLRLIVYRWRQIVSGEDERAIGREQQLDAHHRMAANRARQLGERLQLPEAYVKLLVLAARLHDEGKRSERWQRAFNARASGRPYAKTRGPVNVRLLDGYRHELGSVLHASRDPEFMALDSESQDLVLHLIAAHHGNARPTLATRGCDEAPPSLLESRAQEVALRFARLQRRWGPWGLAWWESLLRAADQQASKDNERGGK